MHNMHRRYCRIYLQTALFCGTNTIRQVGLTIARLLGMYYLLSHSNGHCMLYYQTADHKDIAEKKIIYLFDYIRKRFFLQNITYTDTFYQQLAQKSTVGIEQINKLFQQIIAIKTQNSISQEQLLRLNETIDAFYRQTK